MSLLFDEDIDQQNHRVRGFVDHLQDGRYAGMFKRIINKKRLFMNYGNLHFFFVIFFFFFIYIYFYFYLTLGSLIQFLLMTHITMFKKVPMVGFYLFLVLNLV